ncbi:MAG: acyltransferase [Prevotellaceae bacterium]|jgi:hypothetical protein|nr:acyltransferase [Prevotellaceae bacterium]
MINHNDIFGIKTNGDFERVALEVFRFQSEQCEPYKRYIELLGINPLSVDTVGQIPFLPIQFFKTQNVYSADTTPEITFTSSGTSGMATSRHFVADVGVYERSFTEEFCYFYGNPRQYAILALLPAYMERQGSSLIYMVEHLIDLSNSPYSGFYLHNHQDLYNNLQDLQKNKIPVLLIGVSFALLDFVEQYQLEFPNLIVMETGGMKGRRRELPREELHAVLCRGFGVECIHSEYGMTELLSQAYSHGYGRFCTPPWMRIIIRDAQNPLDRVGEGITGGINIIDLANIFSCSFVETHDLGRLYADGSFDIQGRLDESDVRGCNLLLIE